MATAEHVQLKRKVEGRAGEVLTPQALEFVGRLQREFGSRRQELLRLRDERQVDALFWQLFFRSSGGAAGVLEDRRHGAAPLEVPGLSEDDLWALVQLCPWRSETPRSPGRPTARC